MPSLNIQIDRQKSLHQLLSEIKLYLLNPSHIKFETKLQHKRVLITIKTFPIFYPNLIPILIIPSRSTASSNCTAQREYSMRDSLSLHRRRLLHILFSTNEDPKTPRSLLCFSTTFEHVFNISRL